MSQLINLIKALEDLLVLHKKFRIKLKLSEFTDPVKFNVMSLILDWVNSAKEIKALMDSFLTEYIIRILDNTNFTWHWHIGAAPWEEKVNQIEYLSSSFNT